MTLTIGGNLFAYNSYEVQDAESTDGKPGQ
jgi:hypothetical protein